MKKSIMTIAGAALMVFASCSSDNTPANEPNTPNTPQDEMAGRENLEAIPLDDMQKETLESLNKFAIDSYFKLKGQGDYSNEIYSPISLTASLAMLANGAQGETRSQILSALGEGLDTERLNSLYSVLLKELPIASGRCKVAFANAMWCDNSLSLDPAFNQTLREAYYTSVTPLDFSNQTAVVNLVNDWVNNTTWGLIPSVLNDNSDIGNFVLANALAFDGMWNVKFDPNKTEDKPFTTALGEEVNVPMMYQRIHSGIYENEDYVCLSKYLGNTAFNMCVILPAEGKTLSDIKDKLPKDNFFRSLWETQKTYEVELYMPRFEIKLKPYDLQTLLTSYGITNIFDKNKSALKGVGEGAYVTGLNQYGTLTVDEDGVKAAAVTVTTGVGASDDEYEKYCVNLNRPFMYVICEITTGAILYIGEVNDPR